MFTHSTLLTDQQQAKIKSAVQKAESATSGEIRLFVEGRCKGEVLDRAAFIFDKLEMQKTAQRNGVLFYLATKDKKFAILGDAGIHSKTGEDFWHSIKAVMETYFRKGEFTAGLETGILMAGDALKKNFPHQKDDKNELSDDIVFGKS